MFTTTTCYYMEGGSLGAFLGPKRVPGTKYLWTNYYHSATLFISCLSSAFGKIKSLCVISRNVSFLFVKCIYLLIVEVVYCRVVLEMLYHAMVTAAGDTFYGCSHNDGCMVGMSVFHQETCPLTVCSLP